MKASDVLMMEHRAIERVLKALDRQANRLEAGESADVQTLENIVDFLRNFVDRCHHTKEETALYRDMAKAGIPVEQGPIGVMLLEHEEGRRYIKGMGEALESYKQDNPAARRPLAENIHAYAGLLAQHIEKEDTILFPMGNQVLPDDKQAALVAEFDRIENEHIGPGVHERYHQMIDELDPVA